MSPWALGPEGSLGPAVKGIRFRDQRPMRFRSRVRWFSVGPLGPGALGPR